MLGEAFDVAPRDEAYTALRDEFHDRYEARMLQDTRVFDAVHELVDALQRLACPWGIVTNKSLRFAAPLVRALAPLSHSGTLIGGDSTPFTKPHPEPLLEAARRLGVAPRHCAYVGDDPRDMQAAHAAGMQAWAAAWGYLGLQAPVQDWGAHAVFLALPALIAHLQSSELA
jgi:phosphoglycolate phosphatase